MKMNTSTKEFIKKNVLFLWLDDKQFHAVNAKKRGIQVDKVYKSIPLFLKALRRIHVRFNLPFMHIWFYKWKHSLKNINYVIVHASKITSPVVRYIHKEHAKIKIIVWYWNPVDKCESLKKYPNDQCDRWTFDENDALKYDIKYNTQYYFNSISLESNEIVNDVFFIGADKGRLLDLLEIQEKLNTLNIITKFNITKTDNTSINKQHYKFHERITYNEVLEEISKSKCILDFVSEGQSGLTLRPMESIFFRKKLITNDVTIVDRDFYDPKNIFVLSMDELSELPTFLNAPYNDINDRILNRYDFDSWFARFLA